MNTPQKIVFFDGVCNLCNHWVDFLLKRDNHHVLVFSSLQGATAKQLLPANDTVTLGSIVYYSNGKLFYKSAAVIQLLRDLGGFWKLTVLLKIFPSFLRDFFYNWIAKNRYRWFGEKETCRLPTPEERSRFLD
ncbi:MAG: hypothetical protein JWO58_856 [Chitinophagaceae bacterium]|nr:hypothetical protein [Chitinophagaceae bacterium]